MFSFILFKLGESVSLFLPLRAGYIVASAFADMKRLLSPRDRGFVRKNLIAILGSRDERLSYYTREIFRNFARYLIDFFRFSKLDSRFIADKVKIDGLHFIDEALKANKGAVLVSAHLGCWELGGVVMGELGYPISALVLDHKNKFVNRFFVSQRSMRGVEVISVNSNLKRCFRALAGNRLLAILGDRDFTNPNHGVSVEFFGKNTVLPKGPAIFSIRCGAPLIPVFLIREGAGFRLVFEKPIAIDKTGELEEDTAALTQGVARVLERYIRRYPDQWYMFREF